MTVHSGMRINLFASEEQFPELINPVQMAWDTRGRLWVAVWPNYPGRSPDSTVGDSLLVFEDTNGDGRADKMTKFLDDLNAPTGFQFYKDGVLVVQAPDIWFVRDTNGDGRGDWKERILMGLDSADSHHTANAICLEPGGAIYLSDGVFHRTQVETAWGVVRNNDGAIYRFMPRNGHFETYVSYGFANPHGRVFDRWGNDLVTDATGNATYFGPAFSGYLDYPAKHGGMRQFWDRPSRPCSATGILSSRHFPEEFQGNFLNVNVIGFQGVFRVGVTEEGSGLTGQTLEHLVSSTDPNFRPTDIRMGPDGAIYFVDWHNPIIGHMQHHLRDPNRDAQHGRIYRITYEGRPLMTPPRIHGEPIPHLLELLKEPENGTRELAKVELGARETRAVIMATKDWLRRLDPQAPEYQHHLMEGLWVHQWHGVVDVTLLKRMLNSPDHRARAAATRVLCYWRDQVPDVHELLMERAVDDHPRVRLEAIRAASFFKEAQAADIALNALQLPTDYYIDYTLGETLRQLERWWRQAIAEGQPIAANNPAGIRFLIGRVNTAELLKLPRQADVLEAILLRNDAPDAERVQALSDLADLRHSDAVKVLLETLSKAEAPSATSLARLLTQQSPVELQAALPLLTSLSRNSGPASVRQAAWAARIIAQDSFEPAWAEAVKSIDTLTDLLQGIPQILDPALRASTASRVMPVLQGRYPAHLQSEMEGPGGVRGRFVRVELPRRGTLTLAEVQVFRDGQNIAPKGKARQSSTAYGGTAGRAIDGNTSGSFGSDSQTHTNENEDNPWWEVDLGGLHPIEAVAVWNRSENGGTFVSRLQGFTLSVLDSDRKEVFRVENQPAPAESVRLAVGGDPAGSLQRASMRAAVSLSAQASEVFAALASYIVADKQVSAAAQGMRALPRSSWTQAEAGRAAKALLAWAEKIPATERTSQDYVEAVQTADELAGLLPASETAAVRRALREVRVSVFVIRTVREQMRYDIPRLVVEAGKPFEIILENDDFMPHNLVVIAPGKREEVGTQADAMRPDQRDRQGRAYIPRNPAVLAATKLLEAGQREVLQMTAPEQPGDYEYVCTFPGHWPIMWGRLVVTKDVDAYLLAHPMAEDVEASHGDHGDHGAH
jgi:glucose/arabinose dehydrogenase/azurin